jgi:hypothetical protein
MALMENARVLDGLADGLTIDGFKTSRAAVGDEQALVARRSEFRWEWVGTRMHTFVVVFSVGELAPDQAQAFPAEAQDYAIKHKGGLPRGLQTGTATIAVVIADRADEASVQWFKQEPKHRYAALLLPVLARPGSRELRVGLFHGPLVTGLPVPRLPARDRPRHRCTGARGRVLERWSR